MYLTIKETAEYLTLSEAYVEQLVRERKSAPSSTDSSI